MGLTKDRTRIYVKGLGNLQVRMIEPSADAVFSSVGYLKSTAFNDTVTILDIIPETGELINSLVKQQVVKGTAQLQQTSVDEINLLVNAAGQVYAIRYFGSPAAGVAHQYFCFEVARITPGLALNFAPGERLLPMEYSCMKQDSLGFDVPAYYVAQVGGDPFYPDDINLWVDPRWGYNNATVRLLDMSGFAYHGVLTSTGLWQMSADPKFLRFNGTSDAVDFGDNLDDDATGDFCIEGWVRVQAANGAAVSFLSKKTLITGNSAGFALYRTTGNTIAFTIGSGSANATATSSATLLQNVWAHVAVIVDRSGNAQVYVNGTASGSATSVSSIGTGVNALSLLLGKDGTNFYQVDIGAMRVHRWPGGTLGANATLIPAAHFAADRAYYGV